jgi:hypothetical protein
MSTFIGVLHLEHHFSHGNTNKSGDILFIQRHSRHVFVVHIKQVTERLEISIISAK